MLLPPQSPLAVRDAPAAHPAPIAAALPQGAAAPTKAAAAEEGWGWELLAGAVLGMLTLLLLRQRGAKGRPPPQLAEPAEAPAPAADRLAPAQAMPAPDAAPPEAEAEEGGLKRSTVPAPEAAPPPRPVDAVREEMDHALDIAEVMLSYGRTTGAMQAIKDYLHEHPAVSVRPWLKLLDLHRQTGMREDFERTAETVHRHFNVKVPGWDEGVSGEPLRSFFDEDEGERVEILGLEQLPHLLAKIQAAWPEVACQEFLRHLLVDNRGGGRMGFPVSVVAEILLLEDILNDRLAGHA